MRTKITLAISAFLLSVLATSVALSGVSIEERYFETRDRFIKQFADMTNPENDRPALVELEKQLRTIVGPLKIEGFPEQDRINLETLLPELGFGQIDGLRFNSGQVSLVVTTDILLKNYLDQHPEFPMTLSELSKNEEFYRIALSPYAAVTYYAEIPVSIKNGQSFAHAFLGLVAQDIGPFLPKEIFVFVSRGNKIFLVISPATIEVTDIPQCKDEWDSFNKKHNKALDIYRASQLNNEKAFADAHRFEEQGFKAYYTCFRRESKSQPFFAALKIQAQSIVDRLQSN